jgi:ribose 5-phosphate isomerase A
MSMKRDTGERGQVERLAAAARAVEEIREGMVLGYGSGRAATSVLEELARRVREDGLHISGVPSSSRTEAEVRRLGLPLISLDEKPRLDVTIDGADEVDAHCHLVKGGGGALLREKVLARAADRFIIVIESGKLVPLLGAARGVPLEVLPFAHGACDRHLRDLGGDPALRKDAHGQAVRTDNGNWIVDCRFPAEALVDAEALDAKLDSIPGVLETGLFLKPLRPIVYVGTENGVEERQV